MSRKTYATGFERIFDCPAGRRILTQTRTQPARITAPSDGAIDWTAPHTLEPSDWTPPPPSCSLCGEQTRVGWIDCSCPGAEEGGHVTNDCPSCSTTTYTTRHTEE